MVTVKIKGTACSLYNVYTVVTASHGITVRLWYIREVIPWLGSYTMGSYKVLVYIVQATYTIALSWFIELHVRGARGAGENILSALVGGSTVYRCLSLSLEYPL